MLIVTNFGKLLIINDNIAYIFVVLLIFVELESISGTNNHINFIPWAIRGLSIGRFELVFAA